MIEILVSHVKDGNMSSCYSSDGRQNRSAFFTSHNVDYHKAIYLNIKNENIIFDTSCDTLEPLNSNNVIYANADSVVTKDDSFIYCLFGDCVPMVIYDKKQNIVSLTHLGWQSTASNLHLKVIDYFVTQYHSNVNDLVVYLGPSIKKESYKVDKTKPIKQFNRPEWQEYIEEHNDYYLLDLVGYINSGIKQKGIKNINIDKTDTYHSPLYFSHHKSWMENIKDGRFVYGVRIERG